jgi:hypothetical protein
MKLEAGRVKRYFYTICTTLDHILRTDLHCNSHDDITVMDQVAQVLGQKQDCLTDMVEDMSVVNRILILQVFYGMDDIVFCTLLADMTKYLVLVFFFFTPFRPANNLV